MAAADHTGAGLNGGIATFTTVATANLGTLVNAPANARRALVQCPTAFRVGYGLADATALTTANSHLYAADTVVELWLDGAGPAERNRPAAPSFTLGSATGTQVVAVRYLS